MKTRKTLTTEDLKKLLSLEIEKVGAYTYSDKRRTIEEMLRMKGVKV